MNSCWLVYFRISKSTPFLKTLSNNLMHDDFLLYKINAIFHIEQSNSINKKSCKSFPYSRAAHYLKNLISNSEALWTTHEAARQDMFYKDTDNIAANQFNAKRIVRTEFLSHNNMRLWWRRWFIGIYRTTNNDKIL